MELFARTVPFNNFENVLNSRYSLIDTCVKIPTSFFFLLSSSSHFIYTLRLFSRDREILSHTKITHYSFKEISEIQDATLLS